MVIRFQKLSPVLDLAWDQIFVLPLVMVLIWADLWLLMRHSLEGCLSPVVMLTGMAKTKLLWGPTVAPHLMCASLKPMEPWLVLSWLIQIFTVVCGLPLVILTVMAGLKLLLRRE